METRSFSAPSTSREALKGRHLDSGLECVGSGEGHTKPRAMRQEPGAPAAGCWPGRAHLFSARRTDNVRVSI